MRKRIIKSDLTNKKFGKLLVLKWTKFVGKRRYWLCKCDCGNEKEIGSCHLVSGATISCGCYVHPEGKGSKFWKGYGDISGSNFSHIKDNARLRSLQFNLNIEYLWELFLKQNKKCALSGIELKLAKNRKEENTASLDRIDSSKGYIEGNVQWLHKDINTIKWDLDTKEFISLCKLVASNNP